MRTPLKASSRGFTVVELLVAVVILAIVATGLYGVLYRTRDSYDLQRDIVEMRDNTRIALQTVSDDFRHVSYGKDPTQPSIHYAGPDSVTFIADIDNTITGAELISYFLGSDGDPDTPNPNDTVLMKTIADSGGVAIYSAPQAYGLAMDGIQFRYFNGQGVELANPVPSPEQIGEIEILVKGMTKRPQGEQYQEMTLSTTIYPRNLPLSPARSRPSTPACGPFNYPDCQSVTQVWTTPTTNTDGTELAFNDISHFNVYVGTDPDDLPLHSRLARTFNQWTVSGLDPSESNYISVTCVSRSGVESYPCLELAALGSALEPQIPQNVTVTFPVGLNGVRLFWDQVTEFQSGGQITTPVKYFVYRDVVDNFEPDIGNLLASIEVITQYDDTTMVDCQQYFFRVSAEGCGNEGEASSTNSASIPSPPTCPSFLSGNITETPGMVQLNWGIPTTRMDGSPLSPSEIGGYYVVYDSIPGGYTFTQDVPDGETNNTAISGLELCKDYYFNIRAYDLCPALGDICMYNEIHLHTAQPCDPVIPETPGNLSLIPLDDRLNLAWDANHTDCDLYGYRVYYGVTPGGPYNGVGATEGDSPIELTFEEVTVADQCIFTINGLSECQGYNVVVTAIDKCDPGNESPPSAEASGETDCTPCMLEAGCTTWQASASNYTRVNLEIYTLQSSSETLSEITPQWTMGHLIRQIYTGRPLQKIWDQDGSAGENGNIGPQPAGVALDVDDIDIEGWTDAADGEPLTLVFDGDMRGDELQLEFRSLGSLCSSSNTISQGCLFENLDDGQANGWSFNSGSWNVINGELYQGNSSVTALAYDTNSWVSDFVYSTKLKVVYSQTPYLIFRMQNTSNYYLVGLKTYDNTIRIGRIVNGGWTQLASTNVGLNNNTWYNVTVRVDGSQIDVYLDCNHVLSDNVSSMWPSGYLGLRTFQTRAYFDDLQATVLNVSGP
ncbi:MAG: prepilin-type N-terminal cleavage/methylation domain-containing protein [Candidatus Eisenbacteria bacterium]|uniref:Prepilin-type N-terminal cleavage/methylation domain-containing protein n=1 Tax=Eiseniibacteriota bacterium TaxID=2212470 RepID=A0A948RZF7_UNCEI|nr:prepilin-type N-terminal cleavage/methylation domain-containing protein [Candidatus Eisenbacteria bacterium]MBU2692473.1 prepilin-type N-terminal cleavage/methylation domain-containing protein [Candidatus Eisenbacteria bacterium]